MATPLRQKIVNNAQPYLRPGERVQAVMAGQTITGWWALLTYLFIFWLRYRAVLVTDQRILILDTGKWSMTKPKGVVAELPRNIVIGPASGLWWRCEALGEKLYVHRRFHKDVLAADVALSESGVAPLNRGGQPVLQTPSYGGQQPPQAQQWQPPVGQPQAQQWQQPQAQQWQQPQAQQWDAPNQEQPQPQSWPQETAEDPDVDNRTRIRPRNPGA